jgi:hypothetical protein
MTQPTFDPQRSDAIRAVLIDTVEQAPARDRRRHVRIVVLAILAALGIGLGSSAVAVALGGLDLFPPAATEAAPTPTASASPAPTPTPTPTPTTTPHPLVVTGDPIAPRDVLTAPAADPLWSVDMPGAGDPCQPISIVDVSDGYALVQSGPTRKPEDVGSGGCDPTETRLWLALVDTRDGEVSWTREWSWPFDQSTYPDVQATVLGTSGRVLVQTTLHGVAVGQPVPFETPTEVLDLADGHTLGVVDRPDDGSLLPLQPVMDDSGEVIATRVTVDGSGVRTSTTVDREDPVDGTPRWSLTFGAGQSSVNAVRNDSSVLQIDYTDASGRSSTRAVDIDSGATMVDGPYDRSYVYLDGVTLRQSFVPGATASIAGIDAAGNEFWSRSDPAGVTVISVNTSTVTPGAAFLPSSDVLISYSDGRLELVDGLSGQTRWTIDGSACGQALYGGFVRAVDGVLIGGYEDHVLCGIADDGSLVDVSDRPVLRPSWTSPLGSAATYDSYRGWGTGGVFSYKFLPRDPDGPPDMTVRDAVTGEVLWTQPLAPDERWVFAGGYLVGISGGKVFGIG